MSNLRKLIGAGVRAESALSGIQIRYNGIKKALRDKQFEDHDALSEEYRVQLKVTLSRLDDEMEVLQDVIDNINQVVNDMPLEAWKILRQENE